MTRSLVLLRPRLCAGLLALAPLAAPAQFDAAGQAVLMQQHQVHTGNVVSAEQGALHAAGRKGDGWQQSLARLARPGAAASAPAQTLEFRSDPALVARLRAQQRGNPAGLAMTPAQMRGKFDGLLDKYGYSRSNLADVAAVYLVMAWEVVNNANAKERPGGERAVREQMRRALLASPGIRAMDDAQKQALAERLAYSAMDNGVAFQVYRQKGERERLAALQERMRKEVLSGGAGLDLRQYDLTAAGLVKR